MVFLSSACGSGSGSAFFLTALRRRTFGLSSTSGLERVGGLRDEGTLVEGGDEVGTEDDVGTEDEVGTEDDVGTELPPKVDDGGTKDSVFFICFSTRFASSDATTDPPDPNSDFTGESELPLSALSILNEPKPSSSSFFLLVFAGGGDLLCLRCSVRR